MKRAIVNIAFNRPQYLEQVLEGIEKQHWEPRKYDFLAFVDGPRDKNKGDMAGISENATVLQDFICRTAGTFNAATIIQRGENVGCNVNILDALYKVFVENNYDEAIIIEEDVVPLKGFSEWMEWGLENLVGKPATKTKINTMTKLDAFTVDFGTILNVVGFSEPKKKDENPAAYQMARWFTPWGWATNGVMWRKHFANKVELMYLNGCMSDASYSKVHQQTFDLHPAKHKSKFITWRDGQVSGYQWGWDGFIAVVGEVLDLYEAHPTVPRTKNVGKVGVHQDGNQVYPELMERKCTSDEFDLVKDLFVEVD